MSGRSTPVVVTPAASSSRRDSVVPAPSKDKDGTSVKVGEQISAFQSLLQQL